MQEGVHVTVDQMHPRHKQLSCLNKPIFWQYQCKQLPASSRRNIFKPRHIQLHRLEVYTLWSMLL